MPDQKISALPAGTVTPASILPAVNGAVTQKVTVKQLLDIVGTVEGPAGADGPPGADGPAGVDGESVTVFEQPTTPVAFRTGDLWLEPVPVAATGKDGLSLAEVEAVVDDKLSKLPPPAASGLTAPQVQDLIDTAIDKLPKPEPVVAPLAWQRLTAQISFGVTVDGFARAFGGSIHIRGTYTAQFGFIPAQKIAELPAGVPRPAFDYTVLVFGTADGSPTPLPGKLTIKTNGELFLNAPNCNTVVFDGISIPVE
jgi:hypothetical protein